MNIKIFMYTLQKKMPPKVRTKIPDKPTDSQKKKIKQANKAKQNPALAAAKKEKNEAKAARRKETGSVKTFA
jgi:hypothetical protein